jgi:indolepyruvate ferredoxin oxidoreductase, alpha subunit
MQDLLLLGDEAIAQGALDAGLSGVYAYPGTPSTEITEYIQHSDQVKKNNIHKDWSANEKTALEAALGMSYTGKRAMACMKHVGLNVAADAFVNAAITGVNGGLIVVVADDPSMHSSQNEQDSRFYGDFAMIPILEPANQQEAYDMVYRAFDISEKYKVPVLLRITTRLSHSRSRIKRQLEKKQKPLVLPGNKLQFVLLPSNARKQYKSLLRAQSRFLSDAEESIYNVYREGKDKSLGIIACGIANNYLNENFENTEIPYSVLKIGHYPAPETMIKKLYNQCDRLLVLEEGYPFIEHQLRGILENHKNISGRLDGSLPRDGELNPLLVAEALGLPVEKTYNVPSIMVNRPPALCKGCGHVDLYLALNEAMEDLDKGRVFSDIGCYTLGALPPFESINSCVDMGASITMAKGAADAGLHPSVCVIGDSTFTHSGMTGLLDAVIENTPLTIIISDNSTTGMTGGQNSSATGRLADICLGIGVKKDHLKVIEPLKLKHNQNVGIIKNELGFSGVSVIIAQRECVQTAARRKKMEKALQKKTN